MLACSRRVDDFVVCLTAVIMLRSCWLPQSVFVFPFPAAWQISNMHTYVQKFVRFLRAPMAVACIFCNRICHCFAAVMSCTKIRHKSSSKYYGGTVSVLARLSLSTELHRPFRFFMLQNPWSKTFSSLGKNLSHEDLFSWKTLVFSPRGKWRRRSEALPPSLR